MYFILLYGLYTATLHSFGDKMEINKSQSIRMQSGYYLLQEQFPQGILLIGQRPFKHNLRYANMPAHFFIYYLKY